MPDISRRTLIATGAAAALLPRAVHAAPGRAIVSKIVVEERRIWSPVTIGGAGPWPFIIDTGAQLSAIDRKLAEQLKLRYIQPVRLRGIGGLVTFPVFEARDVVLGGGIRQASAVFAGYDTLDFHSGTGGLLAAGLLTARDSELDFDAGEWRVYPEGRGERPGFVELGSEVQRFGLRGASPRILVDAELDGARSRWLLDTGSPGTLLLFPEASRRSRLWDDARPFAPVPLKGIAGLEGKPGRLVRARSLTVGPLTIDAPLVSLYDPSQRMTDRDAGLVGLEVIEQLNLSTDSAAGKLWAQRNARPRRPQRYRLSGLWLDRLAGNRARVGIVGTGSPAAVAGLLTGDVITEVPDFGALLRSLNGPAGASPSLRVERDGVVRMVTLQLKPYL